jgi:hypothetical protein
VYQSSQGEPLQVSAAAGLLSNDFGTETGSLTAAVVEDVVHGTLTLGTDGALVYKPDQDFVGEDRFTYRGLDVTGLWDIAIVTIDVQPSSLVVSIDPVDPDPRIRPVDEVTIRFTHEVTGLGLEDVILARDDGECQVRNGRSRHLGRGRLDRGWNLRPDGPDRRPGPC